MSFFLVFLILHVCYMSVTCVLHLLRLDLFTLGLSDPSRCSDLAMGWTIEGS